MRHGHRSWIFAGLTLGRKEWANLEPVNSKYLAQHKKKQQILLIFRRRVKKSHMKDPGIRLVCEVEGYYPSSGCPVDVFRQGLSDQLGKHFWAPEPIE